MAPGPRCPSKLNSMLSVQFPSVCGFNSNQPPAGDSPSGIPLTTQCPLRPAFARFGSQLEYCTGRGPVEIASSVESHTLRPSLE